jgi:GTPase involved in cell partitioning and DNA repair
VAVTKLDIADEALRKTIKKVKFGRGISTHLISAVTGEGQNDLVTSMWKALEKKKVG